MMFSKSLAAIVLAIGLCAADPTTIAGPSGTIISGSNGETVAGPSGTVISGKNGLATVIGVSATVILSNGVVVPGAGPTPTPGTTSLTTGQGTVGGASAATSTTNNGGVAPTAMADIYMMGAVLLAGAGALL